MTADSSDVVRQMMDRMNAHDLDGMAALMHPDYVSEQPFHPARNFVGRAQMKANWGAILAGVPDLRAEIVRQTQDAETSWSEWHWSGTTEDGEAFELRGVVLFDVHDGLITHGRLFTEQVERGGLAISESVEASSGRRPQLEPEA